MLNFSPQKSQSHGLIILCVIISTFGFIFPNLISQFGLHANIFYSGIFAIISQIFLFQFLHANLVHLLFNLYFLYIAGPEVEARMSKNQFLYFFIFTTIALVICLGFFQTNSVTIGISGFCLAILSYITIDLYNLRHSGFNNFFILLVINLSTGIFIENISFIGHFIGAVCGVVWWFILKKIKIF